MSANIRRFVALSLPDQWLLLRAASVVAFSRILLWVLPFRWLCAHLRGEQVAAGRPDAALATRMAWAVKVVSSRIPMASCLTQALALQWMLARGGQPATLRIGVQKGDARGFEAHAWVEVGGEVLLGSAGEEDRYVPILAIPGDRP